MPVMTSIANSLENFLKMVPCNSTTFCQTEGYSCRENNIACSPASEPCLNVECENYIFIHYILQYDLTTQS